MGVALLLASQPTWAAKPMAEDQLVRAALEGDAWSAQRASERTERSVAEVAPPFLPNPVLEGRHEQANGPAGASTDVLGASVTVDLGLAGMSERRATASRRAAGALWQHEDAKAAICTVRHQALELWLANRRAEATGVAHERLVRLHERLVSLADAGEVSGYDRDRAALTVAAHGLDHDQRRWKAQQHRIEMSALVGAPVEEVNLAAVQELGPMDRPVYEALRRDWTLQALHHERTAAVRALAAARQAGLPDLTLAGSARWDAMPDGTQRTGGYEVGAALELPLLDRNQVQISRRKHALAMIDARIARRTAEVRSVTEAAWAEAREFDPVSQPFDGEPVWTGATARYASGEATLEELLAVAHDVERAELAAVEGAALRRRARLALACVTHTFPEPEFLAILWEQTHERPCLDPSCARHAGPRLRSRTGRPRPQPRPWRRTPPRGGVR